MSAWGSNAKSCKSLLDRVERNDPALTELFILPTKSFTGSDVDRLAKIIEQGTNTHLKILSASGHKIPDTSLWKLGKAIATAATKHKQSAQLSSIAIGDNSMGDAGVIAFCKGIQEGGGKTCLEHIDLSWKQIGKAGLDEVLKTFSRENSPQLHTLNLNRNEPIGQADGNNNQLSIAAISHIETLSLAQCQLSQAFLGRFLNYGDDDDDLRPTTTTTNLKRLDLHQNPIDDVGFHNLLYFVRNSSPLLEVLDTSNCNLTDEALEALSSHLQEVETLLPNLKIWNLSDNILTQTGVSYLAKGLTSEGSSLSKLEDLNLSGNELGATGTKLLANALETRCGMDDGISAVKSLDLTNTNCGIEGSMEIIQRGNLQTLHLFNNRLGSDGFCALASVLKGGHPSLEYLDLGGNGADQASVVVLLNALLESSPNTCFTNRLTTLVVGGNESGSAVEQIVDKVKEVYPTLEIARDKKSSRQ